MRATTPHYIWMLCNRNLHYCIGLNIISALLGGRSQFTEEKSWRWLHRNNRKRVDPDLSYKLNSNTVNIHGFPAKHNPDHHTAPAGLPPSHRAPGYHLLLSLLMYTAPLFPLYRCHTLKTTLAFTNVVKPWLEPMTSWSIVPTTPPPPPYWTF